MFSRSFCCFSDRTTRSDDEDTEIPAGSSVSLKTNKQASAKLGVRTHIHLMAHHQVSAPLSITKSKSGSYSSKRALSLFEQYADNADIMGPEGFEKLCMDGGISMEGALPLILSWQLDAKELAQLPKEQWTKTMDDWK